MRTYTFPVAHVALLHRMVDNELCTLKNHICLAVERDDYARARELASGLQTLRTLFAETNVESHQQTDAIKQDKA